MRRDYDGRGGGGGGSLRNNGTSGGGGGAVSGDELLVIGHAGGNPRGTIHQEAGQCLPNNVNHAEGPQASRGTGPAGDKQRQSFLEKSPFIQHQRSSV